MSIAPNALSRYFLVCRSIELALKAFLLARSRKTEDLKDRLGHDLLKALTWAQQHRLDDVGDLADEEKALLAAANGFYRAFAIDVLACLRCGVRGYRGAEMLPSCV